MTNTKKEVKIKIVHKETGFENKNITKHFDYLLLTGQELYLPKQYKITFE